MDSYGKLVMTSKGDFILGYPAGKPDDYLRNVADVLSSVVQRRGLLASRCGTCSPAVLLASRRTGQEILSGAGGTWIAGDPTSPSIGVLVSDVSSHYGQIVGWEFGTLVLYAEGRNAIVHELELVALTGNAEYGTDPTIWTSYSHDGLMWSMERAISVGAGRTAKRLAWRHQGRLRRTGARKSFAAPQSRTSRWRAWKSNWSR